MVVIEPFVALPVGIFLPYIAQLHQSVLLGLGAGWSVKVRVEALLEQRIGLALCRGGQRVEAAGAGIE